MAQARQPSVGELRTVTHEELVARAASLVPALRERTAEADNLRRVPDANVAALRQAGLFRVLQARLLWRLPDAAPHPCRCRRGDCARLRLDRMVRRRHACT